MKNENPQITIITPTYNSEKYIKQLIENVQQQDFLNFEHLVIDGLSTDNTARLISNYSEIYPNLKLISEKDNGIYDAMNKGIDLARGQWIFFLGCDDYFLQNDILKQIDRLIKDNPAAEIIYGNVWAEMYNRVYDGKFNINKILGQNICHQGMFFRKELFYKIGKYDLKYQQNADYQFNLICWLSGRVKHKYYPITISFFSAGGASATLGDKPHTYDYPSFIITNTLQGDWEPLRKIEILSQCFRKILVRYPFKVFKEQFLNQRRFLIKSMAVGWMVVSFPYYILKVFLHRILNYAKKN